MSKDPTEEEYYTKATKCFLKAAESASRQKNAFSRKAGFNESRAMIFSRAGRKYKAAAQWHRGGARQELIQEDLRQAELLLKSIDPNRSWSDYLDVLRNEKDRRDLEE